MQSGDPPPTRASRQDAPRHRQERLLPMGPNLPRQFASRQALQAATQSRFP